MPKETSCRIIVNDDRLHFQEFIAEGKLLTGDFEAKPDSFECYYEFNQNGQPVDIEIPWVYFRDLLKLCAQRIAQEQGYNAHSLV